jgi:hypothetical protein
MEDVQWNPRMAWLAYAVRQRDTECSNFIAASILAFFSHRVLFVLTEYYENHYTF